MLPIPVVIGEVTEIACSEVIETAPKVEVIGFETVVKSEFIFKLPEILISESIATSLVFPDFPISRPPVKSINPLPVGLI